jgi:hypothetical protein
LAVVLRTVDGVNHVSEIVAGLARLKSEDEIFFSRYFAALGQQLIESNGRNALSMDELRLRINSLQVSFLKI